MVLKVADGVALVNEQRVNLFAELVASAVASQFQTREFEALVVFGAVCAEQLGHGNRDTNYFCVPSQRYMFRKICGGIRASNTTM